MTGCSYGCKLEKISFYSYLTNQGSSATVGKQTLMSVQMGLRELEQIVSKDVKILRDKIEETNRHYNNAK